MNTILLALQLKADLLMLQLLQQELASSTAIVQEYTGLNQYVPESGIILVSTGTPNYNSAIENQIQQIKNNCIIQDQQTEAYYSGFIDVPGCGPAGVDLGACDESGSWKQQHLQSALAASQAYCNTLISNLESQLIK